MTTTRRGYNGHPSYNYWNVALWIGNDEGLYRLALDCIRERGTYRRRPTRREAATRMLESLAECGTTKTPDGAPYTVASIMHGMRGLA